MRRTGHRWHRRALLVAALLTAGALAAVPALALAHSTVFVQPFSTVSVVASTIPANGDVNPYGVAVVPRSVGHLTGGDILVSNFNNSANLQGTGTTIVQVSPSGNVSVFARINAKKVPGGVGLTTALVALRSGWVIVGSLPTTDGTAATATAGELFVIDAMGNVRETISGQDINGPWDMTAFDGGSDVALFVTNVLNGTVAANGGVVNQGTVVRLSLHIPDKGLPQVMSQTIIGSGFAERTDPAALVIGPTGVGLGANGTLYVADSLNNSIAAIPSALTRDTTAGTGERVSAKRALNDPLGLAIAPNGDILTVNGNDGNLVETTPRGMQVAVKTLDSTGSPPGAGTLFGLAVAPDESGVYFVDDGSNTLNLLH